MYQRMDVREGMTVRSIDGEKLGKVFAVQDGEFLIEKGLFFPKDYVCRYSEISDIRDGEIILVHGKEGLHRFSFEEDRGVLAGTGGGAGVGPGAVGIPAERSTGLGLGADTSGLTASASAAGVERPMVGKEAVSVPVHQEELDAIKREKRASGVRVRKDFIEEEQRAAETVRREEVDIRGDEDVEGPRKLDLTPDDPTLRRS